MNGPQLVGMILFGLIAAVSVWLVWHDNYEDGLFGRLALGGMAFSSGVLVLLIYHEAFIYDLAPAAGVFAASVALFMLRHAYRFWRFCAYCEHAWRAPASREVRRGEPGDQA